MAERTAEVHQLRGQVLDGVRARAQEIKQESGRLKGKVGIITGVGPEVGIGVSVFTGNKSYVNVVCRQLLLSYFLKKARHPWCRRRSWEYAERYIVQVSNTFICLIIITKVFRSWFHI